MLLEEIIKNMNESAKTKKVVKTIYNYIKSNSSTFKKNGSMAEIQGYFDEVDDGDYESIIDDLMSRLELNYNIKGAKSRDIEGFIGSEIDKLY